jgi:pimeloyl-ACP methyl ester carboxylesterase
MFRTRFKKDIVAEFLPPARLGKKQKLIVLCDGMPSIPRKQSLMEFLSGKGYWVFYPRYRGAWESGGQFLQRSPHEDVLDVIDSLAKPIVEVTFGQRFRVAADQVFVIGGSFGGAAAILCSLDERVKKVIANCPVVDWGILPRSEKAETSNPNYAAYIREAFGDAYRLSDQNWKKLRSGTFYNPSHHLREITPSKIMMFHAHDDPYVPYSSVKRFAQRTAVRLKSFRRGGHLRTEFIVRKFWPQIREFFEK